MSTSITRNYSLTAKFAVSTSILLSACGGSAGTLEQTSAATADARRVAELTRENARLRGKLAQADLIIDVQKKLSILLGLTSASAPEETKS